MNARKFFALCGAVAAGLILTSVAFLSVASKNNAVAQKSCDTDEKWCCKKTSDGNVLCNCELTCP